MRAREAVIEDATLEGIESADLDLSLKVKSTGKEGSDLDVSVSGPFEEQEGSRPARSWTSKSTAKGNYKGEDVDFDGGLVLLPTSAFVGYEGVEYEVDPTTFSFVESLLDRSQQEGGAESKRHHGLPGSGRRARLHQARRKPEERRQRRRRRHRNDQAQRRPRPEGRERPAHRTDENPACRGQLERRREDPLGRRPEEVRRRTERLAEDRARRVLRRRRPHRPPDRRRPRRRTEGLRQANRAKSTST